MGIGAHSNRQAALSAGVLFITATFANVIGTGLSRSLLDDPDYLTAVSSNANRVAAGALLELVAAGASVGIAISLYPVLKKWGASLALGSVVFRTAEAVMYMLAVASLLSLLALSQRFTTAVVVDPASFRAVGDALLDVREQVALVGVFAFSVGCLALLLPVLSIPARASMAVGLGHRGHHPADPRVLVGSVQTERPDDVHDPGASPRRAGDGLGRVADRQGIQRAGTTLHPCGRAGTGVGRSLSTPRARQM